GRHPGVVTIEGPPLTTPLRLAGPVSAELNGQSDPPWSDWVIRLFAVRPDGFALPLAQGIKRGKFATNSPITVDMGATAALLPPGTRLRVELAGSSFPMYDRNPHTQTGPFSPTAIPARQTLQTGAILLPVIRP
ncbi:MAG: CocE/NonD family hydrolase C-terminal non-catalytic domain-containing protein, partial [Acidobacteriota bacterium]